MALETLLHFRHNDSTENFNARLAGLIPKGIVKGGFVIPEPASLQVRIKGDGISPFILLAFASDGMVIRERNEEHVLPVEAGITSVVVLRAKYVESLGGTIAQFEVIPLGSYQNDPDPDSLIRLCSITPPAGATAVLSEHINMSFRDSIEGFTRRIVRDVVPTKEDLPSVSGFPAVAEVNFLHNDFALGSSITIGTNAGSVSFPLVQPVNFRVAPPSVPGLSRVHPSQKTIVAATQSPLTGLVTVVTTAPHGFVAGDYVRITGNTAPQANQVWTLVNPPSSVGFVVSDLNENLLTSNSHGFSTGLKVQVASTGTLPNGLSTATNYYVVVMSSNTFKLSDTFEHALANTDIIDITSMGAGSHNCAPQADTAFFFEASLTVAWSGTGGSAVDTSVPAVVVAKMAAGVLHSLSTGSQFTLTGTTDRSFEGTFQVVTVVDQQTIIYNQSGYPTADSGNGTIHKEGGFLPVNAIEIGESATGTALNFEAAFTASQLAPDITAMAIGSSLQFMATTSGEIGNSYTLSKEEPGVLPEDVAIVLSGSTFSGGVNPNPSATAIVDLTAGDLYIVMFGTTGTMEIWGYDGVIFRNLTSATTSTLLDFHRRNQFLNEKHLSENEKAALVGSVGIPSSTNRYLTQEDTSTLTLALAAALTGADNVSPDSDNRFLTEARKRGERGQVEIPAGLDYVEVPISDGSLVWTLIVGHDNTGTNSSRAIPFFNIVFTQTLYDPLGGSDRGGPTEYAQIDFSPVVVEKIYVSRVSESFAEAVELNPSEHMTADGIFSRPDALLLNIPSRLWVKLNQVPDNGSATLLFSKNVIEKNRHPAADMLTTPQRILPAQVQDLINRTKELRFNAGIKITSKTIEFPANLFTATNVQNFSLTRFVGSRATRLASSFSINFETGVTTGDVDTVSLIPFTSGDGTLNKWTKYLLVLTPQGRIQVRHVSAILEKATDLAYATQMSSVAYPSIPYADGSYVFAAVNVQSSGSDGTTNILSLSSDNLELYPYQSTNSREYGTPIVCGDGVTSFGHFTGTDAHIRALAFAPEGSTIKLGKGTYDGTLTISKNNITLDGSAGATLTAVTETVLIIVADYFTAKNLNFNNCNLAFDFQGGADNATLTGISYDSGVVTRIKAPSIYSFSPSAVNVTPTNSITLTGHSLVAGASGVFTTTGTLPSGLNLGTTYYVVNPTVNAIQLATDPSGAALSLFSQGSGSHSFGDGRLLNLEAKKTFNSWLVTDGTSTHGVGDFNSPDGIQQAHDIASAGDIIYIVPGTYSRFTVSKDRLQFIGQGGCEVRINGDASVEACISITGSYNQFDNLTLENSAIGIDCQLGATFNRFSPTVIFSADIQTFIKMPQTDTTKHYNFHPLVCGRVTSGQGTQQNTEVTVGDGSISWGDYVGSDAINVALTEESEGTRIKVFAGTYTPISLNKNNFIIEGSGARSVIRAIAGTDGACITVVNVPPASGGSGNKISGFYLIAENNESYGLSTLGIKLTGDNNHLSDIKFEETGNNRIEPNKKYLVTSGFRNRFLPHTGAPTGYISWTVGDGVHSFGDFNGSGAITQAINALPTKPNGTQGVISNASGNTATFSDSNLTFTQGDLYRYLCIQAGVNAGSYRIITCNSPYTEVEIERVDGLSFINQTGVYWNFTTGAKIWVLNGQYDIFTIPAFRSDIEIEAWGGGSDTMIVGSTSDASLLTIDGSRCRIKGFRFCGGDPVTGVAVTINGLNNTLESNRYDTAKRYSFGTYALGNHIYDAPEAVGRTYYTVATEVSRGDFVGSSEEAIQAALNAANEDPHINKVVLGKGTWVLENTINVPSSLILEGSGYETHLLGDGSFAALTLSAGGRQTVKGIRFNNFSNSVIGPATGVFVYGNWLESAPINGNVTGNTTINI